MNKNDKVVKAIGEFLADTKGTLYTIINATRKTIGAAQYFQEGDTCLTNNDDPVSMFVPKWFDITREHKITGAGNGTVIVPDLVTACAFSESNDTMRIKQLRYAGSKKSDTIVVFKASNSCVNSLSL